MVPTAREEETVLKAWLKLCDRQTTLKKGIKEAEEALDLRVYERYAGLSEVEVKALVAEYELVRSLPEPLDRSLPSIEEIEAELSRELGELEGGE